MTQWAEFTSKADGSVFVFESPVSEDGVEKLLDHAEECGEEIDEDEFDPADYYNVRTYEA